MESVVRGEANTTASKNPEERKELKYNSRQRLGVFDWLADIPVSDIGEPFPFIEVSFCNGSRKAFFRNNSHQVFSKGDWVAVEGTNGIDVGVVSLSGELVRLQMKKMRIKEDNDSIKKVLRPASPRDKEMYFQARKSEQDILVRSRKIAKNQKLKMKITQVEVQADSRKIAFYYTADARVDFRELIKVFAAEFKAKIEMRQIGARQESAKVGGLGLCGRELCYSAWLTDLKSVSALGAKYQKLPYNIAKAAGQCGRLKCCLNFELAMYIDALSHFPKHAEKLEFAMGTAILQKNDVLRELMWYSFSKNGQQYPLNIKRVEEILELNKQGLRPDDIGEVEMTTGRSRMMEDVDARADMGFVNDVGQLTLKALTPSKKRHKKKKKKDSKKAASQRQQATTSNCPQNRKKSQNNKAVKRNKSKKTSGKPVIENGVNKR